MNISNLIIGEMNALTLSQDGTRLRWRHAAGSDYKEIEIGNRSGCEHYCDEHTLNTPPRRNVWKRGKKKKCWARACQGGLNSVGVIEEIEA